MTETTTQPDPQVVAWMRAYLRERPDTRHGDAVHAYRRTHSVYQSPDWDALYAAEDAAGKPLTVADIPAGQGAASLFIAHDPLNDAVALWFKDGDGQTQWCRWEAAPGDSPASTALWEHLAATLPTVTEDAP